MKAQTGLFVLALCSMLTTGCPGKGKGDSSTPPSMGMVAEPLPDSPAAAPAADVAPADEAEAPPAVAASDADAGEDDDSAAE